MVYHTVSLPKSLYTPFRDTLYNGLTNLEKKILPLRLGITVSKSILYHINMCVTAYFQDIFIYFSTTRNEKETKTKQKHRLRGSILPNQVAIFKNVTRTMEEEKKNATAFLIQ